MLSSPAEAREGKAHGHAGRHSDAGDHQALEKNVGENAARLNSQSHADSELTRPSTYGKRKDARYSHR
jgi:hypothetical protein